MNPSGISEDAGSTLGLAQWRQRSQTRLVSSFAAAGVWAGGYSSDLPPRLEFPYAAGAALKPRDESISNVLQFSVHCCSG